MPSNHAQILVFESPFSRDSPLKQQIISRSHLTYIVSNGSTNGHWEVRQVLRLPFSTLVWKQSDRLLTAGSLNTSRRDDSKCKDFKRHINDAFPSPSLFKCSRWALYEVQANKRARGEGRGSTLSRRRDGEKERDEWRGEYGWSSAGPCDSIGAAVGEGGGGEDVLDAEHAAPSVRLVVILRLTRQGYGTSLWRRLVRKRVSSYSVVCALWHLLRRAFLTRQVNLSVCASNECAVWHPTARNTLIADTDFGITIL